jgi:putative ABC transport system substrate-binding protein
MKMKTCPDCNGDGVIEKGTDDEQQCPTCGGSGFVSDDDANNEEVIKTSPEYPPLAAEAATKEIPIVFVMSVDPVKLGLVSSLARPAGNITGIQMFTSALENKRFGLLHELAPKGNAIAALIDQSRVVVAQAQVAELTEAARDAGVRLIVVNATTETDLAPAFAKAVEDGAGAMQVCASPNFLAMREQLVPLAARYRLPTIYEWREYTYAGGLMSYGTDLADAYRLEGGYVAKILKPADYAIHQVQFRHQSQDRQSARPHYSAGAALNRGRGDRIKLVTSGSGT